MTLLRETKNFFYENLNPKLISDNKTFWKQVKPFFSDKTPVSNIITLVEGNNIISDPVKCAEIMNNFFSDAVLNLEIDRELYAEKITYTSSPIKESILKYEKYPSILKLKEKVVFFKQVIFEFTPISVSTTK